MELEGYGLRLEPLVDRVVVAVSVAVEALVRLGRAMLAGQLEEVLVTILTLVALVVDIVQLEATILMLVERDTR